MTDIRPRLAAPDEPVCDKGCARFLDSDGCGTDCDYCRYGETEDNYRPTMEGEPCIPGLCRLLAERTEERDAARRELCFSKAMHGPDASVEEMMEYARMCADNAGWSYLYAPTQGGEKGGGE